MKKDIVVICGFSNAGKDTLARLIEANGYHFILSTTTRPMREYESEGNPYHFVSRETFLNKENNGDFIEVRSYDTLVDNNPETWYYGVDKCDVCKIRPNVTVLDILGLRDFKEYYGDRVISFFLYADEDTRRQRCIERGDFNIPEFLRRLEDDKKCFPDEVINHEVDYIIESSIPEVDLEEVLSIIEDINN